MKYKELKTSQDRHKLVVFKNGEYRLIGIANRKTFDNFGELEVDQTFNCEKFDIVVLKVEE